MDTRKIIQHKCASCGEYSFSFVEDAHVCQYKYRWACDVCGTVTELVFSDGGLSLLQQPTGETEKRSIVLLQMRENPAIAMIVSGVYSDNNKYYYEGTCPTNVFRNVLEVFGWGEGDPHCNPLSESDEPIFDFIKEIPLLRAQGQCYSASDESPEMRELSDLAREVTGRAAAMEEEMRKLVARFSA